jgi:3-deoxy-manno-octulosonate cytidylyltransferase (CMP-KDO synthetase)
MPCACCQKQVFRPEGVVRDIHFLITVAMPQTCYPEGTKTRMASAPLIIIPARMAATRLPGKPLAEIHGQPMIAHVLARAKAANAGPVVVATDAQEIADAVKKAGGEAVLTRADHPSGSDRVLEALQIYDSAGEFESVVNIQGDLPTLEPEAVSATIALLDDRNVDISTPAALIADEEEKNSPQVVKIAGTPISENRLRALYFSRNLIPSGGGPLYHHIGVYGYQRSALEKFCRLKPSALEQREKLEQLRALENGMRIDVAVVKQAPFGVDTPNDLERARAALK